MALQMHSGEILIYTVSLSICLYSYLSREEFASDLPIDILPAHKFLQSIHNITIERGWLRLRLDWGENVKIFWDAGAGIYNASDPKHEYGFVLIYFI